MWLATNIGIFRIIVKKDSPGSQFSGCLRNCRSDMLWVPSQGLLCRQELNRCWWFSKFSQFYKSFFLNSACFLRFLPKSIHGETTRASVVLRFWWHEEVHHSLPTSRRREANTKTCFTHTNKQPTTKKQQQTTNKPTPKRPISTYECMKTRKMAKSHSIQFIGFRRFCCLQVQLVAFEEFREFTKMGSVRSNHHNWKLFASATKTIAAQ